MKQCSKCRETKPDEAFYSTLTRGKMRLATYCRPCYQQYQKDFRKTRIVGERRVAVLKQLSDYARSARGRFNTARSVARRRGLGWGLSYETFSKLISRECAYCHQPLNPTGVGLDRKDSALGYVECNVVPCCRVCNLVKSDIFTYAEMLLMGATIRAILERRIALTQPPHVVGDS